MSKNYEVQHLQTYLKICNMMWHVSSLDCDLHLSYGGFRFCQGMGSTVDKEAIQPSQN